MANLVYWMGCPGSAQELLITVECLPVVRCPGSPALLHVPAPPSSALNPPAPAVLPRHGDTVILHSQGTVSSKALHAMDDAFVRSRGTCWYMQVRASANEALH